MKKYLKNIIIFFAVIFCIDVTFGYICRYLNLHAKGGDTKNNYEISMKIQSDVLFFGSSRCLHHYDPKIIEDSLCMTSYNCGVDGNGILYQYGQFRIILNRYIPKVVVFDIVEDYDIKKDDYTRHLCGLRRFSDVPGVSDLFDDISPLERYKMYSQLYRYNSVFIQMFMDNIHPMQEFYYCGYRPVNKTMRYDPVEHNDEISEVSWDKLKKKYFQKIFALCKRNKIILVVSYSPYYHARSSDSYGELTKYCKEHHIPIFDHYSDTAFVYNREFFYDAAHMNVYGASSFSKTIASELKKIVVL